MFRRRFALLSRAYLGNVGRDGMFPNHFAWNCGWVRATVIRREEEVPLVRFGRSAGETTTDCRSKVAVVVIGDAGTMRNGDGQTAAHVGIRNSDKSVETLGE